jgi:hypothetical protein
MGDVGPFAFITASFRVASGGGVRVDHGERVLIGCMWIEFAVLAVPEKHAIGQLLCFFPSIVHRSPHLRVTATSPRLAPTRRTAYPPSSISTAWF